MAALTTEQLECLLDCVVANSTRVLGVFPANCIPLRCTTTMVDQHILQSNLATPTERHPQLDVTQRYCFVLNTHPSGSPGEHWLAFFFNPTTQKLEYFDSFGFPLSMYAAVNAALDACRLLSICVRANTLGMLQSTTTTVCGHYCVAFIHWRAAHANTSLTTFASHIMSTHTAAEQRDRIIVTSLRTITRKHPCCAAQLDGRSGTQAACASRFSQSCCCRGT